jgi:hypothetical protein
VDPLLFIVDQKHRDLHAYLTKEFARDEEIDVIMDRRTGERRRGQSAPRASERRREGRRRAPGVEEQLRSIGFAVVRRARVHVDAR